MEKLLFPLFITWSITSKCNLRCKHCFRSDYEIEFLNEKKIKEFVNLFKLNNVQGIILTGGEPLKSKYLFEILKKINGEIKVGIATNGTLLTPEIIDKLIFYKVKNFQISLDGTNSKINDFIRGNGTFDKIINNIKFLKEKGCNITIAMTVNSYNYEDIKNNSLNFMEKFGLKKLRIEYYIPINSNKFFDKITDAEMSNLCDTLINNNNNNIILQYPRFDDNVGCGAGIFNCVLNSDLSISPCDLLTHKYKSAEIHNINDFAEYWNNSKCFVNWRKKMKCYNCDKKYKCLAIGDRVK